MNTDFHGMGVGEHGFLGWDFGEHGFPRDRAWRTRISRGWDFGEHGFPRDGACRTRISRVGFWRTRISTG